MKIRQVLEKYKNSSNAAFVPFVPAGDPDMEMTQQLIVKLAEQGAQIIEIGVPFSDPVADGPTIAQSYERALRNQVTLLDCLEMIKKVRTSGCDIPIVLFSYFNPVMQVGSETFARLCVESGVNAVLIVDLPPEEADELFGMLKTQGLGFVLLVSPTTTRERLNEICKMDPDFIYYISRKGVTGSQMDLSKTLENEVSAVKSVTRIPVVVGFGVSSKEHAKTIAKIAEGYVVGSTLVECLNNEDKQQIQANFLERANSIRI